MNLLDDDEIIDFDLDANADSFELPSNPLRRKPPTVSEEDNDRPFSEDEFDEEEFDNSDVSDGKETLNDTGTLDDNEEVFDDKEEIFDDEDESADDDEEVLDDDEEVFDDDEEIFDDEDEFFDDEEFYDDPNDELFGHESSGKKLLYDESSKYKMIPKKSFHFKRFRDDDFFDDEEYETSDKSGSKHYSGSDRAKQHQARRPASVLTWILAFSTLCSLGLCIYMLIDAHNKATSTNAVIIENRPIEYTQEEIDQLMAEAADTREQEIRQAIQEQMEVASPNVAEMLRQLFSDHAVYYDSEGYHFIPLPESIERNNLIRTNFVLAEDGEITYQEQDTVVSEKGIDVSQHQGAIDWEQVAASGVDFAMIRVGYRGYGSGVLVTDERFESNVQGALNAGIPVGAYFFTQAITVEEAQEEASYVTQLLAPYEITYPVVIDVEKPDSDEARANSLSQEERTAIICAFCDAVKDAGYTPMIYGNTQSLFGMLDIEQISNYKIWHAFYNDYVYYPFRLQMWQYTAGATVPGIEGAVDLNIWFPEELP